jgi:hypothetical protein
MGLPVVTQPGALKAIIVAAGKDRPFGVVYQPRTGDTVEHFEHVGWLCIAAGNCILMADEVDQVCSAGSPISAKSAYWKKASRGSALNHLVQYGRHVHVAMVGISRTPQDCWLRLRSNALRILAFRMQGKLDREALEGFLDDVSIAKLPHLGKYEYVDWTDDGGAVVTGGGIG